MRRLWKTLNRVLLIILLFLFIEGGTVAAAAAPRVYANAAILIDMRTGQILWEKNADQLLPPASTTKILTAVTALDLAGDDLSKLFTVSENVRGIPETNINLRPGEQLSLYDLLVGTLLPSGNDAAYAVAEAVGGTETAFVYLMNLKAKSLGAFSAQLFNTNGLPDKRHLMSARDIAVISRYAMMNEVFAEIVALKYAVIGSGESERYLKNTNRLLHNDADIIGVKTGTTNDAGQCLVAAKTGFIEGYNGSDNVVFLSVVLNSPDRWTESERLLNYGFDNFHMVKGASAGDMVAMIPVEKGTSGYVPVKVYSDCVFLCPKGSIITVEWNIPEALFAPLKEGQSVGSMSFADEKGNIWGAAELFAAAGVRKKILGIF